jgi:hypothetical protein
VIFMRHDGGTNVQYVAGAIYSTHSASHMTSIFIRASILKSVY